MKYILFAIMLSCLLYGLIAQKNFGLRMVNTPKNYKTSDLGFSQAVESKGFLFSSGIVGWNADFKLTGDRFEDQVEQCFLNIQQMLIETHSRFSDIAQFRFYVVSLDSSKRILINKYLKHHYSKSYKPATTLIGVSALAQEELKLEIEIIAKIY